MGKVGVLFLINMDKKCTKLNESLFFFFLICTLFGLALTSYFRTRQEVTILVSGSPGWYGTMDKPDSLRKAQWLYDKTKDAFFNAEVKRLFK
jgi:hypothetical protein